MKRVLILSANPRKNGNSDILCQQFMKGTREAGHCTEQIYLYDKQIGFLQGVLCLLQNRQLCAEG